jgi:hypothetical protein
MMVKWHVMWKWTPSSKVLKTDFWPSEGKSIHLLRTSAVVDADGFRMVPIDSRIQKVTQKVKCFFDRHGFKTIPLLWWSYVFWWSSTRDRIRQVRLEQTALPHDSWSFENWHTILRACIQLRGISSIDWTFLPSSKREPDHWKFPSGYISSCVAPVRFCLNVHPIKERGSWVSILPLSWPISKKCLFFSLDLV